MPLDSAFDLPEDTRALREVAQDFARDVLAPRALEWDATRHFPVEEMRQAAAAVLGPHRAPVIEPRGGDVRVPQPLLRLGDIGFVVERVCRGHRPQRMRCHALGVDLQSLGLLARRHRARSSAPT